MLIIVPLKIKGGFLFLKFGQRGVVMKKLLRNRGLVERGGGGSSYKEGGFQVVSSVLITSGFFLSRKY